MTAMIKDPVAVLDYLFDWTDWLAGDSDTITAHTVTATTGLTLDSSSHTTTQVRAWVSGGTVGNQYELDCHITTAAGRQDSRKMTITVNDK